MVRDRISKDERRPIIVVDPTCALWIAVARLVEVWIKALKDPRNTREAKRLIEQYWVTRNRAYTREAELNDNTPSTDFVAGGEGDGRWPGSVAEVEYLVRSLFLKQPVEVAMKGSDQLVFASDDGELFYIQTPLIVPDSFGTDRYAFGWAQRSPVMSWMLHASSNPFQRQRLFSFADVPVEIMSEWISSADKLKRAESIFEILLLAGGGEGVKAVAPVLLPGAPPLVLAIAVSFIVALLKESRKKDTARM